MNETKTTKIDPATNNIKREKYGEFIGSRIKSIREAKGKTRAELGALIGLDQNRVQQYENGTRKPRRPLLKKIADALSVDIRAIDAPRINDDIDAIYALFLIEDRFGVTFFNTSDGTAVSFNDDTLRNFISEWQKQCSSHAVLDNKTNRTWTAYDNWRYNYPEKESPESIKAQITLLQNKLKDLEKKVEEFQMQGETL